MPEILWIALKDLRLTEGDTEDDPEGNPKDDLKG